MSAMEGRKDQTRIVSQFQENHLACYLELIKMSLIAFVDEFVIVCWTISRASGRQWNEGWSPTCVILW